MGQGGGGAALHHSQPSYLAHQGQAPGPATRVQRGRSPLAKALNRADSGRANGYLPRGPFQETRGLFSRCGIDGEKVHVRQQNYELGASYRGSSTLRGPRRHGRPSDNRGLRPAGLRHPGRNPKINDRPRLARRRESGGRPVSHQLRDQLGRPQPGSSRRSTWLGRKRTRDRSATGGARVDRQPRRTRGGGGGASAPILARGQGTGQARGRWPPNKQAPPAEGAGRCCAGAVDARGPRRAGPTRGTAGTGGGPPAACRGLVIAGKDRGRTEKIRADGPGSSATPRGATRWRMGRLPTQAASDEDRVPRRTPRWGGTGQPIPAEDSSTTS